MASVTCLALSNIVAGENLHGLALPVATAMPPNDELSDSPDVRYRLRFTPQEQSVLDLVRQGKVDAEIAVRLGFSNAEVKDRIAQLLAKTGARTRHDLAIAELGPAPTLPSSVTRGPLRRQNRLPNAAPVLGGLLVASVLLAWVIFALMRRDAAERPAGVSADGPASVLVDGRQMIDLGSFVEFESSSSSSVTASIDAREGLLVAALAGDRRVRLSGSSVSWAVRALGRHDLNLYAKIEDRDVFVSLVALGEATLDAESLEFVEIRSGSSHPPTVLIWASTTEGGGGQLHARLQPSGRLLIARESTPRDKAIVYATGEALDLSMLSGIGPLLSSTPPNQSSTLCELKDSRCAVLTAGSSVTVPWFHAPIEGTLTCEADGTFSLENGAIRIIISDSDDVAATPLPCVAASTRVVLRGEPLPVGDRLKLEAEGPGRQPLSIVVAANGDLYIGKVRLQSECPCRQ